MALQGHMDKMTARQYYRNLWHTDLTSSIQADTPYCCFALWWVCACMQTQHKVEMDKRDGKFGNQPVMAVPPAQQMSRIDQPVPPPVGYPPQPVYAHPGYPPPTQPQGYPAAGYPPAAYPPAGYSPATYRPADYPR